jgi:hypothetical protein
MTSYNRVHYVDAGMMRMKKKRFSCFSPSMCLVLLSDPRRQVYRFWLQRKAAQRAKLILDSAVVALASAKKQARDAERVLVMTSKFRVNPEAWRSPIVAG